MKRADKADRIGKMLEKLYPKPPIPLDHRNPFELLVAVMLSAQSTDKKVNEITPALFKLGPDSHTMAGVAETSILKAIKAIGLAPTKAKNVKKMSALLVERHQGEVPADMDALEALPGVGHKTASVVMAQAFGVPAFPVDTHIHRLASRWGLSAAKNVAQTERDLKSLFPEDTWNRRHLQIIFFGREYCPARGHDLAECPICSWSATKKRIADESKKKKRA